MSKLTELRLNTLEEEAVIEAAALADPDAQPLTDAELAQFAPGRRPRGRPALAVTKIATNVRLDPDVLQAFKATGAGWQTRINEVLLDWARERGMVKR